MSMNSNLSEEPDIVPFICPNPKCSKKINPADLEVLLSSEEF